MQYINPFSKGVLSNTLSLTVYTYRNNSTIHARLCLLYQYLVALLDGSDFDVNTLDKKREKTESSLYLLCA